MERAAFLALLAGALALGAPQTSALTNVLEDWEDGTAGWTFTGSTVDRDCTFRSQGECSLRLHPIVEDVTAGARYQHSENIGFTPAFSIATRFLCNDARGDTDFDLVLLFDDGTTVKAHLTHGNNDEVTFVGVDGQHRTSFGTFTAGVWHEVRIVLQATTDKGWVELYGPGGVLLGSSAANPGPIRPSTIAVVEVRIEGTPWDGPETTCWFDSLTLVT